MLFPYYVLDKINTSQFISFTICNTKKLVREADHSPSANAEIKSSGALPLLPIRLHDVVLN
jgi:hypothetical protein